MAAKKKMTKTEKLKLIMDDFELFSKNFIYIIDNNNEKVKLELNSAQVELNNLMNKNRFVIVSKARQGGISTFTLAKALWRAIKNENENILIVSYKLDSSKALFEKLKQMNEWLPRDKYSELFPAVRRANRDELWFENGSRITCMVAGNKSIGRGSTYSYIHLSEYAFYTRQEMQLLSAEQSLMKGEASQLTIETTSNGTGNNYYKLFMSAWKGNSKYKAMFIPFFHELYKKQFKHDHDEAEKWFKEDNKGVRLSVKELEPTEKVLHDAGANLRFLMWRRYKLLDMELQEFQQEYPSNPLESFVTSGNAVFDQSKVLERINHVLTPLDRKQLIDEVPEVLHRYINKGFYIYYLPKRGMKYYGGVDTASGSGADYSTVSIFDSDGQQVASFYHNKVPVYKFAEIVDAIGRYFNYAFLTVERNSYGLPLLERLRNDYGYLNLYKQKMFDQRGKKKMQLGFMTTNASKSVLISDYKEQFETGLYNIECKETLQQMQIFQENEGKMGNKKGEKNHDDLVISCALAVQGMKVGKWYV
ncbi:terminase large subunit domain-containing protein [Bacillus marinisedimentorum]|uniref:terminase large subunit domain-containing protein n=1 Tax=Bacillus marinisedimentorum TaxID=1821260 RepID=UPI0007E1769E|nr:terminase family protein [Bacillus marinisedimentorum]